MLREISFNYYLVHLFLWLAVSRLKLVITSVDHFVVVSECFALLECTIKLCTWEGQDAVQVICPNAKVYRRIFSDRVNLRRTIYQLDMGKYLLVKIEGKKQNAVFPIST